MLTSVQNPLVKNLRKLQRAKYRQEQQIFLLEGTHLLEEACAAGWPLMTVCFTPEWQQNHPGLLTQFGAAVHLQVVSPQVLQAIATTVHPDGVIAVARSRPPETLQLRSLGLVLETIQDPGNLGTMIRTAAAAGAEGVLLSVDCVDLENPKVLRASAGQWFRLPMAVSPNLVQDLRVYQQQGWQLVATLPEAPQDYWAIDFGQPTLILLGNEGAGLSESLIALADQQARIPLQQGVESLNVAIAAALLLYEAQRQRSALPWPGPGE